MPPSPAGALRAVLCACLAGILAQPADCLPLDGKDVTAIRAERKLAAANGKLPLPGTPDLSRLDERLAKRGLPKEASVFIRVFKAESELEVWMTRERGAAYTLFATYPICYWSGTLGPKLREGDRQAPEGFYTVTLPQANPGGRRWPQALDIGYPNPFDRLNARTGSAILIHGGCASIGCFAMTNGVNKELHTIAARAFDAGQAYLHVHVFPFRMTEKNLTRFETPTLRSFWRNLKEGYDIFERTHRPPRVSICGNHYTVAPADSLESNDPGPIAVCPRTELAIKELAELNSRAAAQVGPLAPDIESTVALATAYLALEPQASAPSEPNSARALASRPLPPGTSAALTRPLACSLAVTGCRKYLALRERILQQVSATYAAQMKKAASN